MDNDQQPTDDPSYGPAPEPQPGNRIVWHDEWNGRAYWTEEPELTDAEQRLLNEHDRIQADMRRLAEEAGDQEWLDAHPTEGT